MNAAARFDLARAILAHCDKRQIRIENENGRFRATPAGALTPDARQAIEQCRAELAAVLDMRHGPQWQVDPDARGVPWRIWATTVRIERARPDPPAAAGDATADATPAAEAEQRRLWSAA